MLDISTATLIAVLAAAGAAGFAALGFLLNKASTGRNDTPAGNRAVIGGYYGTAGVLLLVALVLALA